MKTPIQGSVVMPPDVIEYLRGCLPPEDLCPESAQVCARVFARARRRLWSRLLLSVFLPVIFGPFALYMAFDHSWVAAAFGGALAFFPIRELVIRYDRILWAYFGYYLMLYYGNEKSSPS